MAALRRMSLVTIVVFFVGIATAANDATFSESSILTVDDLKLFRDWGLVSGYSSTACCLSTNGCNDPATFHANCDNASRTVVVAELANGKRIGGFTGKASWEEPVGDCKTAPESFLFSLSNKYKHTLRKDETYRNFRGNCPLPALGPKFGWLGSEFHVHNVGDQFDGVQCSGIGDHVYECRSGIQKTRCEEDFCGASSGIIADVVALRKLEVFVLQTPCDAYKCPAGFAPTYAAAASPSAEVCCQPECAVPSTQGYNFTLAGGVLTISGFEPKGVSCAQGYAPCSCAQGFAPCYEPMECLGPWVTYAPCSSAGTPYTVSGCWPACTVPSSPGYDFRYANGVRTVSGFNVYGVTCDYGYAGTVSYTVCSSAGTPYTVSGCVGYCDEPYPPSNPGYDFSAAGGVLTIPGFNPTGVSCANGYKGNVTYEVCSVAGRPYKVSGCSASVASASSQDMPSLFLMLVLALLCNTVHVCSASTRM